MRRFPTTGTLMAGILAGCVFTIVLVAILASRLTSAPQWARGLVALAVPALVLGIPTTSSASWDPPLAVMFAALVLIAAAAIGLLLGRFAPPRLETTPEAAGV